MNRFLIVVTGYNCEKYVCRCYESLLAQSYQNYNLILVNDASEDGTESELFKIAKNISISTTAVINNSANFGAAYCRYHVIERWGHPNDIVLLLGMDDCLREGALERINREYEKGVWCTYGSWINQDGKGLPRNFELEFDAATHATRDYRKVKFRSTAPNTFRKFLFDKINPEDFKFNGEWIRATTESPLMFACLEMSGKDRIGVIKDRIYMYQQGRPDNARRRFGSEYQDSVYQHVISIPKYQLFIEPMNEPTTSQGFRDLCAKPISNEPTPE